MKNEKTGLLAPVFYAMEVSSRGVKRTCSGRGA